MTSNGTQTTKWSADDVPDQGGRVADVTLQQLDLTSLESVRAAADPAVEGGQYYGPSGFAEQRGHPKLVRSRSRTTRICNAGSGLSRKNSPASASRCRGLIIN
jgi:hypothetical protein